MEKQTKVEEEYTGKLLEGIGLKLKAKEMDKNRILGEKVELTDEENLAYKYVMLKVESKYQVIGFRRYFSGLEDDVDEITKDLRVSRSSYFSNRKELLQKTDKYLTSKGFGYVNTSRVDRNGLPNRLTIGKYIKIGRDFVYQEPEDGDYYEISGGAEGLNRYSVIRVVKDLEIFKLLSKNDVEIDIEIDGIDSVVRFGYYGVGLIVEVNEGRFEDYMDIGYVLNDLEVNLEDSLGEEEIANLLGKDLILAYK